MTHNIATLRRMADELPKTTPKNAIEVIDNLFEMAANGHTEVSIGMSHLQVEDGAIRFNPELRLTGIDVKGQDVHLTLSPR